MFFIFQVVEAAEQKNICERIKKIRSGNKLERERIIGDYKPFIIKTVSEVTGKFVDINNSDELGIAMLAFSEALDCYDRDKYGSFISLARLVIKRRVIDHLRKCKTLSREINFSELENSDEGMSFEDRFSCNSIIDSQDRFERRYEIMKFNKILQEFKITLGDLVRNSPSHHDTKLLCVRISRKILGQEELKKAFFDKKILPIKELVELCGISRKTVERHRKYIIAISIILSGEFENIREYIRSIERVERKEVGRK